MQIFEDIYNERELKSTTTQIFCDDLKGGEDNLLSELSIGISPDREYLVIIATEPKENITINISEKKFIKPENICGYYDKYGEFTPNYFCNYIDYNNSVHYKK